MPTFNYPSCDGSVKKGVDEGDTNYLHFSEHNDHKYGFHVVDE